MNNYYETLGVRQNSSKDEIKKAFRYLALKFHPDKAGKDASQKFINIYESYRILINPKLRKEYDLTLQSTVKPTTKTKQFQSQGLDYSTRVSKFKWYLLLDFFFDVLLRYDRFSFAAILLLIMGGLTIYRGFSDLEPVDFVVGFVILALGGLFTLISFNRLLKEDQEMEELRRSVFEEK